MDKTWGIQFSSVRIDCSELSLIEKRSRLGSVNWLLVSYWVFSQF